MKGLFDVVGGIAFVAMGIIIISKQKLCHWAYAPFCWEFEGYSTPLGIGLIICGILYVCFDIRGWIRERGKRG